MDLILEYTLRLNGFPIDEARKRLNEIIEERRRDHVPGMFNRSQMADAFDIFHHHRDSNPFYRKVIGPMGIGQTFKDATYEEWLKVPIIRKRDLQVPLEERIGWLKGERLHFHSTSGSSGTPFTFARDKFGHAMIWAMTDQRFKKLGIDYGKSFQARFYGMPLEKRKYYTQRVKDRLSGRYRFPISNLSDRMLEKITLEFGSRKFEYVYGYTSALAYYSRFLRKKGVVLNELCPTLRLAVTASEVCDDIDRESIRSAFGVPVSNEYGAAELDLIAIEDADGDWIVNNETLLIEILDEDGIPCPPGIEGRVVATSLFNKAMPFIRYELGDRAVMADRCKDHYNVLDRVVGRTGDFARTPSGKVVSGLVLYYVAKSVFLKSSVFLMEFMIIQKELDSFELRYCADRDLEEGDKKIFTDTLHRYLENGLKCSFLRLDSLERTRAGKLTHFLSELPKSPS